MNDHPVPEVTDRSTFQTRIDQLRVQEKAHTRAGDALASERRRLPMVEVDATTELMGRAGPVPLIDIFEGRSQLIAYFQMWHTGRPAAEQCEGWTTGRGNEVMAPSYGLLDLTVYGRQEFWEDSPDCWPKYWDSRGGQFRLDGRPTAQWSRIRAGRDDGLA